MQDTAPEGARRLEALWVSLDDGAPSLHWVTGPPGCGKTTALSRPLATWRTLFWEVSPVEGTALQAELDDLVRAVLGELAPSQLVPDPLRFREEEAGWMVRFQKIFQALAERGPSVWIVDGVDALSLAGRNLPNLLVEAWARIGQPGVHLILASREIPASILDASPAEPTLSVTGFPPIPIRGHRLGFQLPYREAARLQGARDAGDALLRWSVFGGHPLFLPKPSGDRGWTVDEAIVGRILSPDGDLFDAPLRTLQARVQNPARYLSLLAALAQGVRKWGDLARRSGVPAGNQLAPYLRRLEEEGWVRSVAPLDGTPGGRSRRYEITDPFVEFWMAHVFPRRSVLWNRGATRFHADYIVPVLPTVMSRGLERVALAYLADHARETLPAHPRVVGSLWAEGVEIALAARLANGQVCYGLIAQPGEAADAVLFHTLDDAMRKVRWGMGREARAPLFFLTGPAEEGLRRLVARNPLARILTPERLFDMAPERS